MQIEELIREFETIESAAGQLDWVREHPEEAVRIIWYLLAFISKR